MTYMLREKPRGDIFLVDEVDVRHGEHTRTKRIIGRDSGFPMREIEGVGRDRSRFVVRGLEAKKANGTAAYERWARVYPAANAKAVKARLRVLREQEAERIAAVDARIEEKRAELHALRRERIGLVHEAWTKGNVVRVNELHEQADGQREVMA